MLRAQFTYINHVTVTMDTSSPSPSTSGLTTSFCLFFYSRTRSRPTVIKAHEDTDSEEEQFLEEFIDDTAGDKDYVQPPKAEVERENTSSEEDIDDLCLSVCLSQSLFLSTTSTAIFFPPGEPAFSLSLSLSISLS